MESTKQLRIDELLRDDVREAQKEKEKYKYEAEKAKRELRRERQLSQQKIDEMLSWIQILEDTVFELSRTGEENELVAEIIELVEERTGKSFQDKLGSVPNEDSIIGGKEESSKTKTKRDDSESSEHEDKCDDSESSEHEDTQRDGSESPKHEGTRGDDEPTDVIEENKKLKTRVKDLEGQMGRDSSNSGYPPSSDEVRFPGREKKGSNQYNGRPKTDRKKGAQKGHAPTGLTEEDLIRLVQENDIEIIVENIGQPISGNMIIRYALDYIITPVIREIHINEPQSLPNELHKKVTYGNTIRTISTLLQTDALVSVNKTKDFLNAIGNDVFNISKGTVYEFNKKFKRASEPEYQQILQNVRESLVLYTDATKFKVNGKNSYIRNYSNENAVLYVPTKTKTVEEMRKGPVLAYLPEETTIVHDHETGLYHFGDRHAECLVHFGRDLKRVCDETGHKWAEELQKLYSKARKERKKRMERGETRFSPEECEAFKRELRAILERGKVECEQSREEGEPTAKSIRFAAAVINRFNNPRYFRAYTLFLEDFRVAPDNNRSERDLRKPVVRRKFISTFRGFSGLENFCRNLSITETIKKEGTPLYNSIFEIFTRSAPHLSN